MSSCYEAERRAPRRTNAVATQMGQADTHLGSFALVVVRASVNPRPGHSLNWRNSMSALDARTTVGNVYRIASVLAFAILWVASFAARPLRAQATASSRFHVDSLRLQGTLEKL